MKPARFNLSTWAIDHQQIVSFLLLLIVSIGYISYQAVPREEDPAFTIKTALINAEWAGASPEDMVTHVTDKIEKTVQELPYIDSIESQTRRGSAEITVNLKDETPPDQVKPTWEILRKKMHDLGARLPEGVGEPGVNDEYDATYGTVLGISAEGYSNRQLFDKAEEIQKILQSVPGTGRTQLLGIQEEQIVLRYSPRRLALMGISQESLIAALRAQNAVTDAGVLRTNQDVIDVTVDSALSSAESLRQQVLTIDGITLPLTSVAEIHTESSQQPRPVFHVNGKPAVGIGISMASGGNMLEFGKVLDEKIRTIRSGLPVGVTITSVADQSVVVDDAVAGFIHVLAEAIVIVLAVSFVSLGVRAGLVVAVAIPVVLAMTFAGMYLAGIGLQRISLGALIIALGLLVDDAMITIESMVSSLERGESLKKAAASAFTTTAFPMLTGTLVMTAGFIPVGFAKSAAGEYCYSLFIVVLISLLSSWVVAVLFSPLSGVWILPKRLAQHGHKQGKLAKGYDALLQGALRHRLKVICGSVLLLLLSFWSSQWMKSEFFPSSDRPELLISFNLPEGTTQQETARVVESFEKVLDKEKGVSRYSSYIGTGAIRFYLPMDVQSDAENRAQLVLVADNLEARHDLQARLEDLLNKNYGAYVTRITPLELGPPVGWPVKYRVQGPDSEKVREIAQELAQVLGQNPDIRNINLTSGEPQRAINIKINQTAVKLAGLSGEQVAQALRSYYSGTVVTRLRNSQRLTDVLLLPQDAEQKDPVNLAAMLIRNGAGVSFPLGQVATIGWQLETPVIERRNRAALITVQADVATGQNADDVSASLSDAIGAINKKLPENYSVTEGGATEDADKGNDSLFNILPVTLAFMLGVMMLQLQSYSRVILATAMAPFGFVGVVAVLVPSGTPMGFVAILGVIALSGMIIRNAVIMISEVDNNVRLNMGITEAVSKAAAHRARPIMLTACAAIFGMIPIARQVFWGPMAYAIIGGLVAATAFTLTLLPVLMTYLLGMEQRKK